MHHDATKGGQRPSHHCRRTWKHKVEQRKETLKKRQAKEKATNRGPWQLTAEPLHFGNQDSAHSSANITKEEYEELTAKPDQEGKMKEVEPGLDSIEDIIELLGPNKLKISELDILLMVK